MVSVNVAVPLTSDAVPTTWLPSMNATWPVGAGAAGSDVSAAATVAVSVTDWPAVTAVADDVSVAVVASRDTGVTCANWAAVGIRLAIRGSGPATTAGTVRSSIVSNQSRTGRWVEFFHAALRRFFARSNR